MIAPSLEFFGGAAVVFIRLANFFQKKGHAVTVLTYNISNDVSNMLKVDLILCSTRSRGGILSKILFILKGCYKLRNSIDVVNPHNFPASLGLFFFKQPSVWMCNEPPSVELRYQVRTGFKKCLAWILIALDRIIVRDRIKTIIVADLFNKKRIKNEYNKDSVIIPYGVDSNFFKYKNNCRKELVILQVGVLTPEKNQMETLRTFKSISEKLENVRLLFVGKPEKKYFQTLLAKVNDWGLSDKVSFMENQTPLTIKNLYYKSGVLIHPVRSQGGWLSAFEAISCGIPIITSEDFTAKDIVHQHSLGIVTKDYVSAIMQIFENPIPDDELQRRAKWVNDNLSWDVFCRGFMLELETAFSSKTKLK